MKKKILSLFLVIAFVAIAAISSTLAYFKDTDHDKNTFVIGDVKIELVEQQRDTDGKLVEYVNDKPLLPAVYIGTPTLDGTIVTPDGKTVDIYDTTINNEQDKVVSVHNTGTNSAYIRVLFAFEDKLLDDGSYLLDLVHPVFNEDELVGEVEWLTDANGKRSLVSLTDDGVATNYSVCTFTYKNSVAHNLYTPASLLQIYLDPMADNNFGYTVGDRYDIKVVAQAVQADGFADNVQALTAAFGTVTVDGCLEWFADVN